jgi:hypothetical protein
MPAPPTAAMLLARGLRLPPLPDPPRPVPLGTVCAITGVPIAEGYTVGEMTTEATTEFLDCFRGGGRGADGHVEEAAARCFKSANPRAGNPCARSHLAFPDAYYAPLIAREAATERGRPCWSDLARAIWPARRGQICLCLITTDTKKRLWHKARTGPLGRATPVYYHDAATIGGATLWVDWPALLDCLDLVEEVYTSGASKARIRTSLFGAASLAEGIGFRRLAAYERRLESWRARPEFALATLIAQRPTSPAADSRPAEGEDG